jgi:hypothetical protein
MSWGGPGGTNAGWADGDNAWGANNNDSWGNPVRLLSFSLICCPLMPPKQQGQAAGWGNNGGTWDDGRWGQPQNSTWGAGGGSWGNPDGTARKKYAHETLQAIPEEIINEAETWPTAEEWPSEWELDTTLGNDQTQLLKMLQK